MGKKQNKKQETHEPKDLQGVKFDKKGNPKIALTDEEKRKAKFEKKVRGEVKKLQNLQDVGDKDVKTLERKVRKRLTLENLDIQSLFTKRKEKKYAKELAKKYLEEFTPKSVSDKNNLKSVIYLEVLQYRLQNVMNELTKDDATAIPLNLVDSIHKNLKEIAKNKERLGLIGKDKEETKNDGFKFLQSLKDKAKAWREKNQGTRTFVCPDCGEVTMLKIRMDKWISQKHPFFKDRFLANKHLMQLYLQKKLNKEDIAKVLESSPDYIDWLIEKLWMTDPEYRKEFRKYENKRLKELEVKLKEAEAKEDVSFDDEDDNLESGQVLDEQKEEQKEKSDEGSKQSEASEGDDDKKEEGES